MTSKKNIALFIDGTWEDNAGRDETNVGKLFEACRFKVKPEIQSAYYISGVGSNNGRSRNGSSSGTPRPDKEIQTWAAPIFATTIRPLNAFLGGAFGLGMGARIREAYAFLCREYRGRNDKIFIFGFSRGAFAARSLAGFISKVGILMKGHEHRIPEAFALYESGADEAAEDLRAFLVKLTGGTGKVDESVELPIHFLGVWDTVGALGLPWRLAELTAPRTEYHDFEVPPNVLHARHAMALHELRVLFPVLTWKNKNNHPSLKQVWFPGAHGDVGGGYPESESGISTSALRWMASEAQNEGLLLDTHHPAFEPRPSSFRLHHKVKGFYTFFPPQVRPQLQSLFEQCEAGHPDVDSVCHFHRSVVDYIFSGQEHRFFLWSVNAALRAADNAAERLIMSSRLRLGHPIVE